ncbi:MAG: hypothetical protein ABFQ95_06565 [Pseudomonadota bacterium]
MDYDGLTDMQTWRTYEDFSDSFMAKHLEVFLYDTYHQLIAMLLYPQNCKCSLSCDCDELREMTVLSLNTYLFERLQEKLTDPNKIHGLKRLLQVPEDHYFRSNWYKAFSLRQIHKELCQKEPTFKRVHHLVWAFIELAEISRANNKGNLVTLKDAQELVLGKFPLKKKKKSDPEYLGGEKAYSDDLQDYKPFCHFLAAFEFKKNNSSYRFYENPTLNLSPEQIIRLFKRAQRIKNFLPFLAEV